MEYLYRHRRNRPEHSEDHRVNLVGPSVFRLATVSEPANVRLPYRDALLRA